MDLTQVGIAASQAHMNWSLVVSSQLGACNFCRLFINFVITGSVFVFQANIRHLIVLLMLLFYHHVFIHLINSARIEENHHQCVSNHAS